MAPLGFGGQAPATAGLPRCSEAAAWLQLHPGQDMWAWLQNHTGAARREQPDPQKEIFQQGFSNRSHWSRRASDSEWLAAKRNRWSQAQASGCWPLTLLEIDRVLVYLKQLHLQTPSSPSCYPGKEAKSFVYELCIGGRRRGVGGSL